MTIAALMVAAGSGTRMGSHLPKQYLPLAGMPVLAHTLRALLSCAPLAVILPVIHAGHSQLYAGARQKSGEICPDDTHRLLAPAMGGADRQASVLAGLTALARWSSEQEQPVTHVLIHDAARPFMPAALVDAQIRAFAEFDGACAALPVVDTLRYGAAPESPDAPPLAGDDVPRDNYYRAQTPQGFDFRKILAAHRRLAPSAVRYSDDVALARQAGLRIALTQGAEENIKLTWPEDFRWAERWAAHNKNTASE